MSKQRKAGTVLFCLCYAGELCVGRAEHCVWWKAILSHTVALVLLLRKTLTDIYHSACWPFPWTGSLTPTPACHFWSGLFPGLANKARCCHDSV